nr:uncharacterized protein LOC117281929 [Nicotiana tomentosiformis]
MDNHISLLNDFNFTKMIEVPAEGRSGGMVILWDHNIVTIQNFVTHNQEIHAMIENIFQQAMEFKLVTAREPNRISKRLGGVIRNSSGGWVVDFNNFTHAATPIQAELLALQQGLQLACDLQLWPLEKETDSTDVLQCLEHGYPTYNTIICECSWLMLQLKQVVVRHSFRQANRVSHVLAKEASKVSSLNHALRFAALPHFLEAQFLEDKGGKYFIRFISDNAYTKLAEYGNQNAISGITIECNMTTVY